MRSWLKNEKGVMAIYAITAILSFIFILSALFFGAVSVRRSQLQTMPKIKEVYEQDVKHKYEIYEDELEKRGLCGNGA